MPVLDRVISKFRRTPAAALSIVPKAADVPIINDGAGNRPSITVTPGSIGLPGASWTPWQYEPQVTQGYVRNSDVYACVSLIAQAAKQVKWWDGSARGKGAVLSAEDRYAAIGGSAAALEILPSKDARERYLRKATSPAASIALLTKAGGPDFIEAWISFLLLAGNDFTEVERVNGRPIMLYLLRPDRVTPNPINYEARHAIDLVRGWQVRSPYGRTRTLAPYTPFSRGELIQSKLFNPLDPIYGMAPLTAAMLAVDMENEGATLFKRVMQRGFSPGWIKAEKDSIWEDTQVAQLKERVKASKLAGEELFLENAEWHQMGWAPVDSGIAQQSVLSKRDIASVFHVDPALIGDTSTRTYATYRESRLALYMEAVIPLLMEFRADWNRTIGAELGSPLDFDRDSFDAITAARQEATDRVVKLWTNGLITQNEARADLEYDAVPNGDIFYAPANLIPLGEQPTEPAAAPADGGA